MISIELTEKDKSQYYSICIFNIDNIVTVINNSIGNIPNIDQFLMEHICNILERDTGIITDSISYGYITSKPYISIYSYMKHMLDCQASYIYMLYTDYDYTRFNIWYLNSSMYIGTLKKEIPYERA